MRITLKAQFDIGGSGGIQKTGSKAAKLFLILVGFCLATPLIMLPGPFTYPYLLPKVVYFRSLTILMLAVYLFLVVREPGRYRIRSTAINCLMGLSFVTLLLSAAESFDPYLSFWDSMLRMMGVFTLAHFTFFYFQLTSAVGDNADWLKLLRVFLVVGVVVGGIGLAETLGWQFFEDGYPNRSSATFGQPSYFGSFGLFILVFSIYSWNRERKRIWQLTATLAGALGLISIFTCQSRGVILALLSCLLVPAGFAIVNPRARDLGWFYLKKPGTWLLTLLGASSLVAATLSGWIPGVERLLATNPFQGSAASRLMAWSVAWDAWQDFPFLGWGPNNFIYAFTRHFDPEFLKFPWVETFYDDAHNLFINLLVEQGIVGLTVYLLLLSAAFRTVSQSLQRKQSDKLLGIATGAYLISHVVYSLFLFEDPSSLLCFYFVLAWLNSASADRTAKKPAVSKEPAAAVGPKRWLRPVAGTLGVPVFLLLLYFPNFPDLWVSNQTHKTFRSLLAASPSSLSHIETVLKSRSPHVHSVRGLVVEAIVRSLPTHLQQNGPGYAQILAEIASRELDTMIDLQPADVRPRFWLAELALLRYRLLGPAPSLEKALTQVEEGLVYSPRRHDLRFKAAEIRMELGDYDGAVQSLRVALNDRPSERGYLLLVKTCRAAGDTEAASQAVQEALGYGFQLEKLDLSP